jgi:hypothetical protein
MTEAAMAVVEDQIHAARLTNYTPLPQGIVKPNSDKKTMAEETMCAAGALIQERIFSYADIDILSPTCRSHASF